jgi:putative Holliday junction resolvase
MAVEGTVLAFDYGTQRIGVAVGQTLTASARALAVMQSRDGKPDWQAIEKLLAEWRPDILVVGMPLTMEGKEQDMTEKVRRFGRQLEGRYNLPVYFADERLSSQEAALRSGSHQHGADDVAAQVILESWFNEKRANNE